MSVELNFRHESKFLDFAKFHPSQKWSKVVKNLIFEPDFQHKSNFFLDFVKFYPLLVWSGQNSHFLAKFSTQLKISGFCQISSFACTEWAKHTNFAPEFSIFFPSGQKCQFWAKCSTWIKISWFCKISSFAGQEW